MTDEPNNSNVCKAHMAHFVRLTHLEECVKTVKRQLWALIILMLSNLAALVGGAITLMAIRGGMP